MSWSDLPAPNLSLVQRESVSLRPSDKLGAIACDDQDGRAWTEHLRSSGGCEISTRCQHDSSIAWTEAEIVRLQFILLDECRGLANPAYPLSEKLDILRWIFADEREAMAPFSFYRCVRCAWGSCDVEALRDTLMEHVPEWLNQALVQCPVEIRSWVRDILRADPTWLSNRLDINPQFINETARALKEQPVLF